jgi:cobalt/nickel transport system permease protein
MRPDALEGASHGAGPLHRVPAGPKLLVALLALAALALAPPRLLVLGPAAAALLVLGAISRVAPRLLLRRLLLLEPFAVGVAALALLRAGGGALFLGLIARATLCLAVVVLLAATTRFADTLRALRRAHVPALLCTTLALLYRYLFVLLEESARLRRARDSRTFRRGRRHAWRNAASLVGRLFVRASARAERIYAAMCARGLR